MPSAEPSEPFTGYVFAYFTGNTADGEAVRFATSRGNDVLRWDPVAGGRPVITSSRGTLGLRDPFLLRSPHGGFHLLVTDLSIGRGTSWEDSQRRGSRYLEVWDSADLVTWSAQRHVLVAPEDAGNTWAPEAFWDAEAEVFVVYWASSLWGDDDERTGFRPNSMLFATTRDFVEFSEPRVWQDRSRIDSTVVRVGDVFHRFTKDEFGVQEGVDDVLHETSTDLLAPLAGWTPRDSRIGTRAGTGPVEAPIVVRANPGDVNGDGWFLFVDEYGGRGYVALRTADLDAPDWRLVEGAELPAGSHHGSVLPVTAAELAAVRALPAAG